MRRNDKINTRITKQVARRKYAERQIDKWVKWRIDVKGYMLDGSFQPKSVLDGPFNEWHENGNLKKSGLYLNGMKHYTWKEWNDKGEEIKSEWNHVF